MLFEKTTKRTVSSVTVKGWSGKNTHHPRKSETSVSFVGVDGEGMNVNGTHRYVLLGVGEQQIENPAGLSWTDTFEFLYRQYRPSTAFVGFFLGYDFTQVFKTLPEDKAWMLLTSEGRALRRHRIEGKTPHPVRLDGWDFDVLAMKRLRIRPSCDCPPPVKGEKGCTCKHAPWMYVCDVGSFFQSSFLTVIDPSKWSPGTEVVTDEEYATIKAGKESRSTAVLDNEMRMYNRLENTVLSRVMRTLDAGFHGIGIHLPASKWFGPGQAAQAWLKKEGVPTREESGPVFAKRDGKVVQVSEGVPFWFWEPAKRAYFGGWFEQFVHGIIPGESHEYDINSAYPSVIAQLPCLLHGRYSRGEGIPVSNDGDLVLVYANVWDPAMPDGKRGQHIGAMLHRDSAGRIFRPHATEGWFWWDELKAAQRAGLVKRLDNRGKQQVQRWVRYEPCDCPCPMRNVRGLYQRRLDVGKTSPLGKAAKLVYNSDYGKFAQSIGEPIFGNPVYASRITSECRRMILDAIASHPKGKADVSMVATDAVYFNTPHPGLSISEALGEWDHTVRTNLTLFKPGVYWDDETRRKISEGGSPHFKARGFRAADFVSSITRVDREYERWGDLPEASLANQDFRWPAVQFRTSFAMTTALQALRQRDWSRAGRVSEGTPLVQDSDPYAKRSGLYREEYDGRTIYRSDLHWCMNQPEGWLEWIPSTPYDKGFGMNDPWSDEYKSQLGINEDGYIADILSWILQGE